MNLLLTSTGFDNDNILFAFNKLLSKPADRLKALFIPTALNDSREYVQIFMDDLYKAGILDENIDSYDLDKPISAEEIVQYDIVFVCPGSPEYLLQKMAAVDFKDTLDAFLENGGIYIGVSAGSDAAAKNFPDALGYLGAVLETHAKEGSPAGDVDISVKDIIKITDNQAVLITDDKVQIIE